MSLVEISSNFTGRSIQPARRMMHATEFIVGYGKLACDLSLDFRSATVPMILSEVVICLYDCHVVRTIIMYFTVMIQCYIDMVCA